MNSATDLVYELKEPISDGPSGTSLDGPSGTDLDGPSGTDLVATATVHHYAIRFKMNNKKHIVNLESFRDMLYICPMVPDQSFVEPPFEEEILAFIRFLGHSAVIRKLTDVNINKLYQPWRSFAAIINKCLIEKSSGYDSLRLSQAQILWGLYHKRNVDYAYLMWEYFVYQVEHKESKKSNEMYYPWFTKVIIHHFMSKDPSIPRRNKVNWHYVRDDHMFSTIKLVSRHQNTQQFGALLPIELTNADIRNSNAYKEYYAVSTGVAPPKPKASVRKTRSSFDTTITPPTAATNEGTGSIPGVPDVPTDESEEELSWNFTDEEGDDDKGKDGEGDDDGEEGDGDDDDEDDDGEEEYDEETRDDESFDPIPKTPENSDDQGNGEEDLGLNVGREEGHDKEEEEDKLYKDVNINQGRGIQTTLEVEDLHVTLTPVNPDGKESIFETTLQMDAQTPTSSDKIREEAQNENDEFPKTIDENMQKIIKEQVKEQVKVKVSKILPRIEQTVNEQLEAKVLTQSSNSSKTSYVVDAGLFEMELKKILIEKMEGNKDVAMMMLIKTDQGSKRRREGKKPESASAPMETATRSAGSLVELEYHLEEVYKATTDQLDWVNPEGASSRKYTTSVTKTKAADYEHIKWIEDLVPRTMWIEEPIGYDKQDLWGRRVEDLQLGVESYQKKLNLTKLDTYRSDLKRKEAYIAYSNPRGFIYQNKDKKNRLMRIDELHKFSDGTLTDVRTALDDRLKGIRMKYLPQSIWRKSDKERAAAMIQAIDKRLKTRRIMRSLEWFVGGRLYEGDFRMLHRTI
nr:hypothetical protein [Tanacetum cinerariifolium]